MYDARSAEARRWALPCVIIEHENSHRKGAFFDDFWKTLSAHAPLRITIGYCGVRTPRESWIEEINGIAAIRAISGTARSSTAPRTSSPLATAG